MQGALAIGAAMLTHLRVPTSPIVNLRGRYRAGLTAVQLRLSTVSDFVKLLTEEEATVQAVLTVVREAARVRCLIMLSGGGGVVE
jgi:hypothetical protein